MKFWIAVFILVLSQGFLVAQNKKLTMEEMHQLHQDSNAYISFLEDPQRDAYQKPREVIMALGIREGEAIEDIGAGSGYFTFRLAGHVGDKGRVYAVDVSSDMILLDEDCPRGSVRQMESNGFKLAKEQTFLPCQYFLIFTPK